MKRKFFFLNICLVSRSAGQILYKITEIEAQGRKLRMSLKPKKYLYIQYGALADFRFIGELPS